MAVKEGLRYTEDHEWIKADGDTGTIGITDYAQEQLGEIVFVELPQVGKDLHDFSLDTVKMFYEDGRKAGFTL